jgi:hypothetical protein
MIHYAVLRDTMTVRRRCGCHNTNYCCHLCNTLARVGKLVVVVREELNYLHFPNGDLCGNGVALAVLLLPGWHDTSHLS